ncbi:MAG TPA: hypothetical protein VF627_04075 [Abditibacterium sp.]|jgi:hypothetical protein
MKPDCRRVLSQIASYSVEELSAEDIDAFTRHLDDCPPCKGHWVLFEKTLTTLSQVGEADVSVHQSQRMWLTCLEHAKKKAPALAEAAQAQNTEKSHSEVEVLPHPFRSDSSQREGDRRNLRRGIAPANSARTRAARVGNLGWLESLKFALRPSWGLALAGASALVLAASLLASPAAEPAAGSRTAQAAPVPALPPMSQPGRFVAFQTPPRATTGLIDYHSSMAFEPFSDHVAPTLVSHTATQP